MPEFKAGFADLKSAIQDEMGDPLECEHADGETGDVLQSTTSGLAYWRKSTNTPSFTNGNEHWALRGDQVLHWATDAVDPPEVSPAQPTAAASALPTPVRATTSPQPSPAARTPVAAPTSAGAAQPDTNYLVWALAAAGVAGALLLIKLLRAGSNSKPVVVDASPPVPHPAAAPASGTAAAARGRVPAPANAPPPPARQMRPMDQATRTFIMNLLEDAGPATAPEALRSDMAEELYQRLDAYLFAVIGRHLSTGDMNEYLRLSNQGRPKEELDKYLSDHIPDAARVISEAMIEFRTQYLSNVSVTGVHSV